VTHGLDRSRARPWGLGEASRRTLHPSTGVWWKSYLLFFGCSMDSVSSSLPSKSSPGMTVTSPLPLVGKIRLSVPSSRRRRLVVRGG
jgi:hypothetical protein